MSIDAQHEICLDAELLRIIQETSRLEQRITKLFELLRDPLYRYLTLVLRSPSDAEDLTQEVFLRLYTTLAGGQAVKNIRAWLFRVARNLAIDLQRKKNRLESLESQVWTQVCLSLLDPAPNAEHRILEQEKQKEFLASLQRLSTQERHCLYLRIEGLNYSEIAEIIGVSTTTIPTFLSRGIKKLRKTHD